MNRGGFYYFLTMKAIFTSCMIGSGILLKLKKRFLKDINSNMYNKFIWLIVNYVVFLIMFSIQVACYLFFYYYFIDINKDDIDRFKWFMLFLLPGTNYYGVTLGFIVSILVDHKKSISPILMLLSLPFTLVSGFIVQVKSLIKPLKYLSMLSAPRYIY